MKHSLYTSLLLLCFALLSTNTASAANFQEYIFIEGAQSRLEHILSKKIYLQAPDGKFLLLAKEHLEHIFHIEHTEQKLDKVSFAKDTDILQNIFGDKRSSYESPAEDVTIKKAQGDTFIIEGKMVDGFSIDQEKFAIMLLHLFENDTIRAINVPVITRSGKIIQDGTDLELVTQGVSDFKGSSKARLHNIVTSYSKFQGHRIASGETFSFNNILGEVDGANGYMKELVIKGPKTVPDWGGGVCQVSSTFFRAALEGGFPIEERRNHSYAVSYYEPWGNDATIYTGVQDFKFTNDSPSDLIVHTYHTGTRLYVNFYGKKDGRKTQLEGPSIFNRRGTPSPIVEETTSLPSGKEVLKEYGHPGFTAQWKRTTLFPTGNEKKDTFTSIYEARPGRVARGI